MILAIDIGNSSISCGIYTVSAENESQLPDCICRFKIASKHLSADEYMLLFRQFLQYYHIGTKTDCGNDESHTLDAAVISSVVPTLTETISRVARILTGAQPLIIGQGVRTGFGIKIKNPEQLGADIVSNTAAAFLYTEPPFVILDAGTATTITYVNGNKELLGTIIIPGLAVSMEALSESAALLSHVPLEKPQELLGKSTGESVRSGVMNGHALMIDGFIRNIREQYSEKDSDRKLGLIASGGLAEAILPYCRNKFLYLPDLTLTGAVQLFRKNNIRRQI